MSATLARLALAAVLLPGAIAAQEDTIRLQWVPNPRAGGTSWVSDPARHLRPATVARIDSTISALERETTAEIAVVVLDTLDGLEPGRAAFLLHRRWGVGKRARDNGLVLLWSPRMRRIHVSVGDGLEGVITDGRAGRIQDEAMLPLFRRNEFDAGMIAGVAALAAAAREEKYTGLERARASSPEARRLAQNNGSGDGGVIAGIVGGLAVIFAAFLYAIRRPRKCPKGHGRMKRLGEAEDNAFLEKEAVLEEKLGSMNYEVWECGTCDERLVVPRRKWFTQYEDCPQCKRRTVAKKTKQLVAPTYTSTGERLVTRTCKNCDWKKTTTETIPVRQRSSSSSGSSGGFSGGGGGGGGGGFGGGSSSGGGAGRSY
jgi:uncharacterized protein